MYLFDEQIYRITRILFEFLSSIYGNSSKLGLILIVSILISTTEKALVQTCGLSHIVSGFTSILFGIIVVII